MNVLALAPVAAVFALGRYLLFRELGRGSWIVVVAIVAALLLLRYWRPLVEWLERRWRSR